MTTPTPHTLLAWLIGGAIGAAGILQGLYWKSSRAPVGLTDIENRLRNANEEIGMLKRENESLRSLAQGGGEFPVPREFIDSTEKEFGLRFLSSPVIHRIAGEELRDRIGAAIESRLGPSGIDDRQKAYSLIGWLRPDDDLLTQLAAIRAMEAGGWFDDVTGDGWMNDRADLKNIPDQAALVRLLVRILFHQNFPPAPAYPGDDADRAREALHQGTAAGSVARFYAEKARTLGFMPMKEDKEAKLLFASLPPFLQGLGTFPGVEGKGFSDALFVRGNEKLHDAFRKVPQTTRAIFVPGESSASPVALDPPATPEEPLLAESAGQLGLLLWLRPLGDAGAAAEIAAAWKGDRYVLFPDGKASAAVLWEIELDSAAAVDRLQAMALRLSTAMSGREDDTHSENPNGAPEGRHLAVVRITPTRLRFLNTADAGTAAKLGGR
jgi:hypothetical protein